MATRTSVVLASAVAGVVVLAVVAGVLAATRSVSAGDPATPSGAVQAYLQSVADGSVDEAAALLAPESSCTVEDLTRAYLPSSLRAVLGSVSVDGDSAVVTVQITEGAGDDPFSSGGYSHDERFVLVRSGADWSLSGAPWPMYDCGGSR
ncbi:hypothetical protein [Actinotalea sp.]|uniref:hypothetical protein n=1 Tax=Actinotalea sp. TaxID=1872145 RepID=UPI003564FFEE